MTAAGSVIDTGSVAEIGSVAETGHGGEPLLECLGEQPTLLLHSNYHTTYINISP